MSADARWTGSVTFWKGERAFPADRHVCVPELPFAAVVDGDFDEGRASGVVERLIRESLPRISLALLEGPIQTEALFREILQDANRVLFGARGGGASALLVAASEASLVVAHVGDCRMYARDAGAWRRVTRDHTLGEDPEHPMYGQQIPRDHWTVVTRQLGGTERLSVDTYAEDLSPLRAFLLCTNGAWESLDFSSEVPVEQRMAGPVVDAIGVFKAAFMADREPDNATIVAMERADG